MIRCIVTGWNPANRSSSKYTAFSVACDLATSRIVGAEPAATSVDSTSSCGGIGDAPDGPAAAVPTTAAMSRGEARGGRRGGTRPIFWQRVFLFFTPFLFTVRVFIVMVMNT